VASLSGMNRGLIAWAVVAVYVLFAAVGFVVRAGMGAARLNVVEGVGFSAGFGLFAALGALLIVRRRGHHVCGRRRQRAHQSPGRRS
jgi:hypothetical protein